MIEAFNGWFLFILYLLNLAGGGFYAYQSVLNTENFMEKYGIHRSALLPALFIQSLIFTVLGYISVKSDVAEMEGVKYTAEGYIAPAIFTVVNAVLIWGLSDKIYM